MSTKGEILRRSRLSTLGAIVICCLAATPSARSQEAGDSRLQDDAGGALLKSMWEGRSALNTGWCRIKERRGTETDPGPVISSSEIRFDVSKGAIRVEHTDYRDPFASFRYVESPNGRAVHYVAENTTREWPAGQVTRRMRPRGFLDPRNLGLATRHELDRRSFEELQSVMETYITCDVSDAESEEEKFSTLVITAAIDRTSMKFRRELTLDSKRLNAPIRIEWYTKKDTEEWAGPLYTVETQWEQVSQTLVPVKSTTLMHSEKPETRTLEVVWLEVNTDISSNWFQTPSVPE